MNIMNNMNNILSVLFFFISDMLYAVCEFKTTDPVVSLSGPVTHYLYQLGLHSSPQLKAISIYHGLSKDEFRGEILPGGILLPSKTVEKYKNALFFYDESLELEKSLTAIAPEKKIKIVSKDKTPFEVYVQLDNEIKKHLNKDCNSDIITLSKKINEVEKKIKNSKLLPRPFLFFLGKINGEFGFPETILLNDGFGLYLIRDLKQKSYPSNLAYIPWSQKVLTDFIKTQKPLIFSIQSEQSEDSTVGSRAYQQGVYQTIIEMDSYGHLNIFSRCALIPGLPQIYFLEQLIDYFKR